jgi:hypothetical protein
MWRFRLLERWSKLRGRMDCHVAARLAMTKWGDSIPPKSKKPHWFHQFLLRSHVEILWKNQ